MLRIRDEIYIFQYFPPSDHPQDVFGGKPPNPPFVGATAEESSVYYYWWLFLRENADYIATCVNGGSGPCAELYRDFRDVRRESFSMWWLTRGCELFCELDELPDRPSVRNLTTRRRSRGFDADDELAERDREVLIAVDRSAGLSQALALIRDILENELLPTTARPSSTALYPVFTKPVLTSLHKVYQTHCLRRDHPKMPLHEVAAQSKLYQTSTNFDPNAAASAASRGLAQARLLIEFVGKGVFPVMKKSQIADATDMTVLRGLTLSAPARMHQRSLWRR